MNLKAWIEEMVQRSADPGGTRKVWDHALVHGGRIDRVEMDREYRMQLVDVCTPSSPWRWSTTIWIRIDDDDVGK